MTTVNLGPLVYQWRGAYDAAEEYGRHDVVRHNNANYICLADTVTGTEPAAGSGTWDLMLEGVAGTPTDIPSATEVVPGVVELATVTEAQAGTDTARAVTPAGLAAAHAGTVINVAQHCWSTIHRVTWTSLGNVFSGSQWTYTPRKAGSKFLVSLNIHLSCNTHTALYLMHRSGGEWRYWTDWQNYNTSSSYNPGTTLRSMGGNAWVDENPHSGISNHITGLIAPGLEAGDTLELAATAATGHGGTFCCNETLRQDNDQQARYGSSNMIVFELGSSTNRS